MSSNNNITTNNIMVKSTPRSQEYMYYILTNIGIVIS